MADLTPPPDAGRILASGISANGSRFAVQRMATFDEYTANDLVVQMRLRVDGRTGYAISPLWLTWELHHLVAWIRQLANGDPARPWELPTLDNQLAFEAEDHAPATPLTVRLGRALLHEPPVYTRPGHIEDVLHTAARIDSVAGSLFVPGGVVNTRARPFAPSPADDDPRIAFPWWTEVVFHAGAEELHRFADDLRRGLAAFPVRTMPERDDRKRRATAFYRYDWVQLTH